MGWLDILKQSLTFSGSYAGRYTPHHKIDPHELGFTKNARMKMQEWSLSEADIKDVFYHGGTIIKQNMVVKKYNGYEIGLYYFQDKQTGRCIISSAWKQDRY
jgi:hypothetical protein